MLRTSGRHVLLFGLLLLIGLTLTGYLKYRAISLSPSETYPATPRPPIALQPSRFECLGSRPKEENRRRVVVLHGADWTLKSTVDLKCFPEREVSLSVEVGRYLLQHPIRDHFRFWIVKKG